MSITYCVAGSAANVDLSVIGVPTWREYVIGPNRQAGQSEVVATMIEFEALDTLPGGETESIVQAVSPTTAAASVSALLFIPCLHRNREKGMLIAARQLHVR